VANVHTSGGQFPEWQAPPSSENAPLPEGLLQMLECSVAVLLRMVKALRGGHSRNKGLILAL
jgi:hypothetical protein